MQAAGTITVPQALRTITNVQRFNITLPVNLHPVSTTATKSQAMPQSSRLSQGVAIIGVPLMGRSALSLETPSHITSQIRVCAPQD